MEKASNSCTKMVAREIGKQVFLFSHPAIRMVNAESKDITIISTG